MESKIALIAIESGEQQTATTLTEGQRKECFTYKLMGNVCHNGTFGTHINLFDLQSGNIGVPWYYISAIFRCGNLAHVRCKLT